MQGFLPYAGEFLGDFYYYSDRNDISLLDFPKTDFSTHHVADFLDKYFVSY
ncbi:MAG: hypothetical protein F6K48_08165 [Okeania sp. SIO3H1]|uniref:hypothetical protein n=1 Tax=Okeania sp. SIO1I7 TaxID=2607772 RepID=UPI0013C9FC2D|nr:hypothetical protein [Okeania sp. SIO1I7]NEN88893.1 hypothetical protein [Okeania sp. SIO3H1]NET29295.1 hypothetical protein [Okeania sp. SIO1I7]